MAAFGALLRAAAEKKPTLTKLDSADGAALSTATRLECLRRRHDCAEFLAALGAAASGADSAEASGKAKYAVLDAYGLIPVMPGPRTGTPIPSHTTRCDKLMTSTTTPGLLNNDGSRLMREAQQPGAAPGAQPHLVFDLPALIFRHLAPSNCLDVACALRRLTMAQYRADKEKAAAPAAPVAKQLFAP
jgi:hypothetical protein